MSSDDPIVRLNVGGRHFDAFRSTLTRSPFFARMLDGTMSEPNLDTDGRIFLDRDPDGFAAVLRYLRTGMTKELDAIERESFEYFGLEVREDEEEEEAEAEPEKEDEKKKKESAIAVANLPGFQEVAQELGRHVFRLRPCDYVPATDIIRWVHIPAAVLPVWKECFGIISLGLSHVGALNDADLTAALKAILNVDRFSLVIAELMDVEFGVAIKMTLRFAV